MVCGVKECGVMASCAFCKVEHEDDEGPIICECGAYGHRLQKWQDKKRGWFWSKPLSEYEIGGDCPKCGRYIRPYQPNCFDCAYEPSRTKAIT